MKALSKYLPSTRREYFIFISIMAFVFFTPLISNIIQMKYELFQYDKKFFNTHPKTKKLAANLDKCIITNTKGASEMDKKCSDEFFSSTSTEDVKTLLVYLDGRKELLLKAKEKYI